MSTFHKDHPEKPTAMSSLKNSTPPMVKLTAKLVVKSLNAHTKRKRGKTSRLFSKQIKEAWVFLNSQDV